MNDLMKEVAVDTAASWTATLPLVVFSLFFLGMLVWAFTADIEQPDLE